MVWQIHERLSHHTYITFDFFYSCNADAYTILPNFKSTQYLMEKI
jgi:hypothetical protein